MYLATLLPNLFAAGFSKFRFALDVMDNMDMGIQPDDGSIANGIMNIIKTPFNWIQNAINSLFQKVLSEAVMANISGMFDQINDSVTNAAQTAGLSPQTWNSEVFGLVKNINDNVVLPFAGMILTAVLCIELIHMVIEKNNLNDGDTFAIFKWIIKAYVAVYLVSNAFTFTLAVFDVSQNFIGRIVGAANNTTIDGSVLTQIAEGIKAKGTGELLVLFAETWMVKFALIFISLIVMVVIYGRFFEIYAYAALAALPFATLGNGEWGQIGKNFIRGLFALGLQGVVIIIAFSIYSVLIRTINFSGNLMMGLITVVGFGYLLAKMLLRSGSIAKSIVNAH